MSGREQNCLLFNNQSTVSTRVMSYWFFQLDWRLTKGDPRKGIPFLRTSLNIWCDARSLSIIWFYTTIHTNEAIWLVLERAWLEYRSRLTSHNIKTRLFRYFNCIFLPFIDTFYKKYGGKHHGINTRLVRRKFWCFSTRRRRIRKLSRFATVSEKNNKIVV